MLKYLVILLDETSVSFCHYRNAAGSSKPIPVSLLKQGIMFALKENLSVQFVYPQNGRISEEAGSLIDGVDHVKIVPVSFPKDADVRVVEHIDTLSSGLFPDDTYVLQISKEELFAQYRQLLDKLGEFKRLNLFITDVERFQEQDFQQYETLLKKLSARIKDLYRMGQPVQVNLLTDRLSLSQMNNCNAGWESVTLAPDGRFYACPAFYYEGGDSIGSLDKGLDIKNPHLYQLKCAPICRECDAFHCHRCVWLNKKMTLELNTPSHEQCVLAHLERNASRDLMKSLTKEGFAFSGAKMKKIGYLDPLDKFIDRL